MKSPTAIMLAIVARFLRCIHAAYAWGRRHAHVESVRRILVVKLDAVGDSIIASAFIREVARSYPGAQLTVVVSPSIAPLLAHCPFVKTVISFSPPSGATREGRRICAYLFAIRHLWPQRFDIAFLPRWDVDYYLSAVLLCASGARTVVAWRRPLSNLGHGILNQIELRHAVICDDSTPSHEVLRNLRLLRAVDASPSDSSLEAWITEDDRRVADTWLAKKDARGRPLIALGIGAADSRRQWPAENVARLAKRIIAQELGCPVLIGFGTLDRAFADEVGGHCRDTVVLDAVGCFSLRQTCALLEKCDAFIGNDSGPMHMAAAVGLPVVEISGLPSNADPNSPFSPLRFGPWGVPARIMQPAARLATHPADDPAILDIAGVAVDDVFAALEGLLRDESPQLTPAWIAARAITTFE